MDSESKQKLTEIKEWLSKEFTTIRTGQATPSLLDGIRVESYGTVVPLNQVANVGIEDARTLRINPWDSGAVGAIESAIRDADLGVSVMSDSAGVRVSFPDLTAERRTQLSRIAKGKLEEARVSVRSVRDEFMKEFDRQLKAGDISEDDRFAAREQVQHAVEDVNRQLEQLYMKKDTELQS